MASAPKLSPVGSPMGADEKESRGGRLGSEAETHASAGSRLATRWVSPCQSRCQTPVAVLTSRDGPTHRRLLGGGPASGEGQASRRVRLLSARNTRVVVSTAATAVARCCGPPWGTTCQATCSTASPWPSRRRGRSDAAWARAAMATPRLMRPMCTPSMVYRSLYEGPSVLPPAAAATSGASLNTRWMGRGSCTVVSGAPCSSCEVANTSREAPSPSTTAQWLSPGPQKAAHLPGRKAAEPGMARPAERWASDTQVYCAGAAPGRGRTNTRLHCPSLLRITPQAEAASPEPEGMRMVSTHAALSVATSTAASVDSPVQ